MLGTVLRRRRGRRDEAIEAFRTALRLAPSSTSAMNGLGATLLAAKRRDEAAEHLAQAARTDPHDRFARSHHSPSGRPASADFPTTPSPSCAPQRRERRRRAADPRTWWPAIAAEPKRAALIRSSRDDRPDVELTTLDDLCNEALFSDPMFRPANCP